MLHTFDNPCCAVLTTDASNFAVAAVLAQLDDKGTTPGGAQKQPKLTAAESDYQGQILELLAVVHALWWFQHCLLGGGGP